METPKYEPSPLDAGFAQLLTQSKAHDIDAMQERLRGDTASLNARFGANPTASPTSADPGSILARYGANLAMAGAGKGM